jgi:hypothetical protein
MTCALEVRAMPNQSVDGVWVAEVSISTVSPLPTCTKHTGLVSSSGLVVSSIQAQ